MATSILTSPTTTLPTLTASIRVPVQLLSRHSRPLAAGLLTAASSTPSSSSSSSSHFATGALALRVHLPSAPRPRSSSPQGTPAPALPSPAAVRVRAMKVAVVGGSGNVGSRLAHRLCLAGVDVVLASRNPEDAKTVEAVKKVKEGAQGAASAATFQEAVASADAIIIATPGYATAEEWKPVLAPLVEYAGVVLDASNPLTPWPQLDISADQNTTSAAEEIQKVLSNAKVFKAFNTLGAEIMSNPVIGGKKVTMLYAGPGDDAAAKETAEKVISSVGFEPVLVGPIRAARNLESIAELWIHMNIRYGFSNRSGFAFDLLQA